MTRIPSSRRKALPDSNFWKKQLRQWHWISSAICLAGLLLFAVTGVTLNHASSIEADPKTTTREFDLPADVRNQLGHAVDGKPLPEALAKGIKAATGISVAHVIPEVSDGEIAIDLAGPGVDAFLSIDLDSGQATHERIERGTIAVLNDLHKGRDSGPVWSVLIDVIAIACVLFSLTGLGLLWLHAKRRPSTWPLTGIGLAIPLILYLIFVHS